MRRGLLRLLAIAAATIVIACNNGESSSNGGEAELASLTVSKGRLSCAFDPDKTSYLVAPIPFSDSPSPAYDDSQSVDIVATAAVEGSTILIDGSITASGAARTIAGLKCGATTATLEVSSPDGKATKAYTLTLFRALPIFNTGAGPLQNYTLDPREDGSARRGASWPSDRFIANVDGTITDLMTGLIWPSTAEATVTTSWDIAIDSLERSTASGTTDWRIPNLRELRSLINYGQVQNSQWLSGEGFGSIADTYFWSGTAYAPDDYSDSAWLVSLQYGLVEWHSHGSQFYAFPLRGESRVLPVTGQTSPCYSSIRDDGAYRQGVAFPPIRFRDEGDGTITDLMTGLVWLKAPGAAIFTWQGALSRVDDLNAGRVEGNCGYADWRLPNVNELESLLDYGQAEPYAWLNGQGFVGLASGFYWSSTSYAGNSRRALGINLGYTGFSGDYWENNAFSIIAEGKGISHYALPVRGGY